MKIQLPKPGRRTAACFSLSLLLCFWPPAVIFLLLPRVLGNVADFSDNLVLSRITPLLILLSAAWLTYLWSTFFRLWLPPIRELYPRSGRIGSILWAFLGAVIPPLALLSIALPLGLRRHDRRILIPALTASCLSPIPAILFFLPAANAPLFYGSWIIWLAAFFRLITVMPDNSPFRKWSLAPLILPVLYLIAVQLSLPILNHLIDRQKQELEVIFDRPLTRDAFRQYYDNGLPANDAPHLPLIAFSQTLEDINFELQTPPPLPFTPAELTKLKQFEATHLNALRHLNRFVSLPYFKIGHDFNCPLPATRKYPEIKFYYNCARFYSLKLRSASDRSALLDANGKIARIRDYAADVPTLIGKLAVIMIENLRINAMQSALSSGFLTDNDLLDLQHILSDIRNNQFTLLREGYYAELRNLLDLHHLLANPVEFAREELKVSSPQIFRFLPPEYNVWIRLDLLHALNNYQKALLHLANPTLTMHRKLEWKDENIPAIYPLSWMMQLPLSSLLRTAATLSNRTQAARCAIAVEQYRRQNHQLPEALQQLVPEFLPEIPRDNFTDTPLLYRQGKLELYSSADNKEHILNGYRIYAPGQRYCGISGRYDTMFTVRTGGD